MKPYPVYFFDFDGVILDSNALKIEGFRQLFSSFPSDLVEALIDYHRQTEGISRFVKIRYFYEILLKQSITDSEVKTLANRFSEIMLSLVLDPRLVIQDTLAFIQKIAPSSLLFVVSGTEEKELQVICKHLGLSGYFKEIKGSPVTKAVHFRDLLSRFGHPSAQAVMIGDSRIDFEAARDVGCDFWGYNNTDLIGLGQGYVTQFTPELVFHAG